MYGRSVVLSIVLPLCIPRIGRRGRAPAMPAVRAFVHPSAGAIRRIVATSVVFGQQAACNVIEEVFFDTHDFTFFIEGDDIQRDAGFFRDFGRFLFAHDYNSQ
jgi:hypothetical protein